MYSAIESARRCGSEDVPAFEFEREREERSGDEDVGGCVLVVCSFDRPEDASRQYGQYRVSGSDGGVCMSGFRRSTKVCHETPSCVIEGTFV